MMTNKSLIDLEDMVSEEDQPGIEKLIEEHIKTDEAVSLLEVEKLTDKEIKTLVKYVIVPFTEALTGIKFFAYQKELASGIAYSVVANDGATITALFARQSGKSETVSCIILGLGILLPKFAEIFKAEQFARYKKNGFMVGIYGPDYDKAGIIYNRMKKRIHSRNAKAILNDPMINLDPKKIKGLKFPTGFRADLRSAGKNVKVEGFTYHLLVLDEAQDIDSFTIRKSIRPMKNFYNGTIIYIGTPVPEKCEFSEACHRNDLKDQKENNTKNIYRRHYQFDYTHVARANPDYAKSIEQEKEDIGEDSDEFRMAYKLEWLESRGRFITFDMIKELGVKKRRTDKEYVWAKGRKKQSEFIRPHGLVSSDRKTENQVFSLDYGGRNDSTVMTIARVWWDNPILLDGENRYHIHILDWLEIVGDDHEDQYPKILDKLDKYDISMGINDSTGKGDVIHDRLSRHLLYKNIDLHPFIYSLKSKHDGYTLLKQEISAGRLTFPWSEKVKTYKKHKRFVQQMTELVKEYKGQNGKYMSIRHADSSGAHDDYPDSLMQLVWLVNKIGNVYINIEGSGNYGIRDNYRTRMRRRNTAYKMGKGRPRNRFWRK